MRVSVLQSKASYFLLAAMTGLLSACQTPYVKQAEHHLQREQPTSKTPNIPAPVATLPTPPTPEHLKNTAPKPTYTVVVTQAPARELLTSIARDARLNIDVHPAIEGYVTLNALRQTLPQILDRIAQQIHVRWRLHNNVIIVEPDTPYLKTYHIDYVNLARTAKSDIGASSVVHANGNSGSSNTGGSKAHISNESHHKFWENLIKSLENMLKEADVVTQGQIIANQNAAPIVVPSENDNATAKTPNPSATQKEKPQPTPSQQTVRVVAHAETGMLSVHATAEQHQHIQRFLEQIMRSAHRQVMIEATIVEVELSHRYSGGINWESIFTNGRVNYTQGFASLVTPNGALPSNAQLPILSYANHFGTLAAAVQLLEQFGKTKVLSSPKLMALNNQPAILKAVKDRPYFTMKINVTEGTSNTTARTTYESTLNTVSEGLVLSIQPQIAANGEITLNVRPTISSVIGYVRDPAFDLAYRGTVDIRSEVPIVQVRELESTLRLSSGQIAILGGLIQDSITDQQAGLPGISRVPLFGNVFKFRQDQSHKTELVVFLKPTLVNDPNIDTDLKSVRELLPPHNFFRQNDYSQVTEGMPAMTEKPYR